MRSKSERMTANKRRRASAWPRNVNEDLLVCHISFDQCASSFKAQNDTRAPAVFTFAQTVRTHDEARQQAFGQHLVFVAKVETFLRVEFRRFLGLLDAEQFRN